MGFDQPGLKCETWPHRERSVWGSEAQIFEFWDRFEVVYTVVGCHALQKLGAKAGLQGQKGHPIPTAASSSKVC